jgi:hypothetical protein
LNTLTPIYDFSALPFANDDFEFQVSQHNLGFSLEPSGLGEILLPMVLRVVCFLPWCVAVGAAIVMFPQYLEFVAFHPGYVISPHGIDRFKHWADTGMHHIWIFLGFLVSVYWIYPRLGLLLIGGVLAQFLHAWHDFTVDRSIPLGEDDRQTIYLVTTHNGLPHELIQVRKTKRGYLISSFNTTTRVQDDSDEE